MLYVILYTFIILLFIGIDTVFHPFSNLIPLSIIYIHSYIVFTYLCIVIVTSLKPLKGSFKKKMLVGWMLVKKT